ncbi:MBL fold metallo-hydrolase [Oscillospiraceae bacterium OttesenSCG-928-G22]|nr:MBL fold metallo-hydrolase [Oscillospiraceae bacterium OttesenSCG-928-G22]
MGFIRTLASGSSGNAAVLSAGGTTILIDAGISCRRIAAALHDCDLSLSDIDAILLTHEHGDHIAGLQTLSKKTDVPLYCSAGTRVGLIRARPELHMETRELEPGCPVEIGGVGVTPFRTPHDTDGSVGFVFSIGRTTIGFATDIGHIDDEMSRALLGVDCLYMEANHDIGRLLGGPYPPFLKRRVMGPFGHLANGDAAAFIRETVEKGTRRVALCHLSRENNTPELAEAAVYDEFSANHLPPSSVQDMLLVSPAEIAGIPFHF